MPSTGTRLGLAVLCLLGLGACSDVAVSRVFTEPPPSSYDSRTFQVRAQTRSESVEGARVTPEFFRTTGVRPLLGRSFVDEEYKPGSAAVVLISHDWWKTRFEGSPQVIGTRIELDGQSSVVVGILQASFHIPKQANLWIPKQQ
jgi:putative ABC transport system permease protein